MSFCERLKEQRESIGMSRSELAEILGITQAAIGNYENGISTPKADILFKVFDALKCDANYLFQDEMNNQKAEIFSVSEIKMIKVYRSLDPHGKKMVDFVLNEESERCKASAVENNTEYIELVARGGKHKVKKADLAKWLEQFDPDDYEVDHDLV